MTFSQIKGPLFVLLLLLTVRSESRVLDKSTIKQGENFTVTCDDKSVLLPSEFNNVTLVKILKHELSNPAQFVVLAQYKRYGAPRQYQYTPPWRNWTYTFSNQKIRITLHVLKSHYLDEGAYLCHVQYINKMGKIINVVKAELLEVDDTTYIKDAEIFTITCDADHAFVLANYSDIVSVNILKTAIANDPVEFLNIATYIARSRIFEEHIPDTRNWLINFSGARAGIKNRAMKIELVVRDSKCSDTGMYYCNVSYIDSKTTASTMLRVLNIIVQARPTKRVFNWEIASLSDALYNQELVLYYVVIMICKFQGPSKNASMVWKVGKLVESTNTRVFIDYFNQGQTVTEDLPPQNGNTCQQKWYKSKLEIIINQFEHKNDMFACFLRHQGKDTEIGNVTPNFTDIVLRKSITISGSQTRQLSRNLLLLCLSFAFMMLQLGRDAEP